MPTLQKYEKRLTTLEEALMQDQAQDLDKKLFRIRRELSVFAAYYEQLDDLFAVLSEETEEGDPHASRLFDHLTGRASGCCPPRSRRRSTPYSCVKCTRPNWTCGRTRS